MEIVQGLTHAGMDTDTKSFFSKVFMRMGVAMALSGGVARYIANTPQFIETMFGNSFYFYGIFFLELGLVWYLSRHIRSLSLSAASGMFILYSALNGTILSVIFLVYQLNSIVALFGATAAIFVMMGRYGYTTNTDLTRVGSLAFTGLIGVVIAGLINLWLQNSILDIIVSSVGVIIFVGFIAYDIQTLKSINTKGDQGTENEQKEAIIGALELYLDFVNLFLNLLSLFGDRK